MMPPAGAGAALEPVRAALLARAREQAAAIVGQARREAAAMLADARRAAADTVARAQADAEAQAAVLAAAQLSRGRRDARSRLLHAQRDAYDQLRRQVRAAVDRLPAEPGYDRLLDRLTRAALAAAGPGARVTPHPGGGVVATAPGVVVDCSLPALADQAVDAVSEELATLWEPEPRAAPAGGPARAPGQRGALSQR